MVAIVVALVVSYALTRRLPVMALVTAVVVVVFGAATLFFQNETFIKLKPTIIYLLFTVTLFGGLIFKKPLLAMVFDQVFHLTDEGWRKLTVRWALFFLALAVLNEIVWRTHVDRHLGDVQGVRRDAAHLHLRGLPVSAADEARREPQGSGKAVSRASRQPHGIPIFRTRLCDRLCRPLSAERLTRPVPHAVMVRGLQRRPSCGDIFSIILRPRIARWRVAFIWRWLRLICCAALLLGAGDQAQFAGLRQRCVDERTVVAARPVQRGRGRAARSQGMRRARSAHPDHDRRAWRGAGCCRRGHRRRVLHLAQGAPGLRRRKHHRGAGDLRQHLAGARDAPRKSETLRSAAKRAPSRSAA